MKNRISLFLMLMLVAGVSHAELKIGYVNVAKVLEKAPQAAKAKTRLETEFSRVTKRLSHSKRKSKTLKIN